MSSFTKKQEILLSIHEAYYENTIEEYEYYSLLLEYTLAETRDSAIRTGIRETKSTVKDILGEVEKVQRKLKNRKDVPLTISDKGFIAGVATAAGINIALMMLVGGADIALSAATAMVVTPLAKYNLPFVDPIYRTTVKPFLEQLTNRKQKKAETIADDCRSLKERIQELRSAHEDKKITPEEAQRRANALMKNVMSCAMKIDKLEYEIQKSLNKLDAKIQENKNKVKQNPSNENYKKLNKLKVKKESIEETQKYLRDNTKGQITTAIVSRYAAQYNIEEGINGKYSKSDMTKLYDRMLADKKSNNIPNKHIIAVQKYIEAL